jgi:hypothetical protein
MHQPFHCASPVCAGALDLASITHSLNCRKPALLPSRKEIRDKRFAQLIARALRPARISGLELVLNRWNALSRILSVVSGTSTILHLTFRSSMVHSDCYRCQGARKAGVSSCCVFIRPSQGFAQPRSPKLSNSVMAVGHRVQDKAQATAALSLSVPHRASGNVQRPAKR